MPARVVSVACTSWHLLLPPSERNYHIAVHKNNVTSHMTSNNHYHTRTVASYTLHAGYTLHCTSWTYAPQKMDLVKWQSQHAQRFKSYAKNSSCLLSNESRKITAFLLRPTTTLTLVIMQSISNVWPRTVYLATAESLNFGHYQWSLLLAGGATSIPYGFPRLLVILRCFSLYAHLLPATQCRQ